MLRRKSSMLASFLTTLGLVVAGCAPEAVATPTPKAAPPVKAPIAETAVLEPAVPLVTPKPAPEQPRFGGTITISSVGNPPHLDAHQSPAMLTYMVVSPSYNTLLQLDLEEGEEIVPSLAESWEVSKDGLLYTFRIRKGVKFHDGSTLTAEDVAYNIERVWKPPKGITSNIGFMLEQLEKVERDPSGTVKISLKVPFAALPAVFAYDSVAIYPKKVVEEKGDMKTTVLGTGPFKFDSYTPGVSIEVSKNKDYWVQGRPYLDKARFLIIRDTATTLAAVKTGRVMRTSRFFGLTPGQVEGLKKGRPALKFHPTSTLTSPWFFMNLRKPPFNDLRVRKAMSLALDRQAAMKVLGEGPGTVGRIFYLKGWGLADDELMALPGFRPPKEPHIVQAKELLREAGYASGFDIGILARSMVDSKEPAVFLSGQLAAIGVRAKVEVAEDAIFWDQGRAGRFDAMVFTPGNTLPDVQWMGGFFEPGGTRLNFTGNDDDKKLADLWANQSKTMDVAQRKKLVQDVERHLLADAIPLVPIVWLVRFIAVAPDVMNFVPGVTDYGNNNLQEVWLAR